MRWGRKERVRNTAPVNRKSHIIGKKSQFVFYVLRHGGNEWYDLYTEGQEYLFSGFYIYRCAVMFFTSVYDYIFIIQIIAVCASVLVVFYPFKAEVRSVLGCVLLFCVLFALATLVNWGMYALSQVWTVLAGIHFSVSWFIVIFLYLMISRIYLPARAVMGASLYTTVIVIADLGRQVMVLLPSGTDWSFVNIVFYMLIIVFSGVIRSLSLQRYRDISPASVAAVLIGAALSCALVLYKTHLNMTEGSFGGDSFYVFTLALLYVLNFAFYVIIYWNCRERKRILELETESQILRNDREILTVAEEAVRESREFLGDLSLKIRETAVLLETERYDEAMACLEEADRTLRENDTADFVDCGNPVITSVINMEILKAKSSGIVLVATIHVPPVLPIEKGDLSRALISLLDSAIESILAFGDRDYLADCRIMCTGGYLYIGVRSHRRGDSRDGNFTDSAAFGKFTEKVVRKIAEKYNGVAQYVEEDGECITELLLCIADPKGEENGGENCTVRSM